MHDRQTSKEPSKSRSRLKTWCFRLVLLLVSNAVFFGGLEIIARLVGFGYPTSFFNEGVVKDSQVVEANHRFFWSFFPKALSRSPQPFQFTPEARPNTHRIIVFGESAAMGDPEPAFGLSRILEEMLNQRHPQQKFEVLNLAVTAINSHVVRPIALESARFRADFWCVYMGNNEVHGQFGPGTVFGASQANLNLIRSSLAVKRSRIGQFFNALTLSMSQNAGSATEWSGMSMFTNRYVFSDDPRLLSVYDNFKANLQDIAKAGVSAGTQVLISDVAVNLRGSSPFKSEQPQQLNDAQREQWDTRIEEGRSQFEAGLHSDALTSFAEATKLHPNHAETHFMLGQCHWALTDYAAAQKSYQRARDLDGLRFRTDGKLNQIIRDTAKNHPSDQVSFVSSEALVSYNAPNGIPGDELFWDHVHFRFPGNYLVALAFAQEIEKKLYSTETLSQSPPWISLGDCAQALTLTRWSDYQMTQGMRLRLTEEPFRSQSIHPERSQRLAGELQGHLSGVSADACPLHKNVFETALQKEGDDYVLRDLFARFLLQQGKVDEATDQWAQVVQQVPSHLMAHFQRGKALVEDPQRAKQAEESLRKALEIRPETVDIMAALGQALTTQGRHEEALHELNAALQLRPTSIESLLIKSRALNSSGRKGEAIQTLEKAAKIAPQNSIISQELKALKTP